MMFRAATSLATVLTLLTPVPWTMAPIRADSFILRVLCRTCRLRLKSLAMWWNLLRTVVPELLRSTVRWASLVFPSLVSSLPAVRDAAVGATFTCSLRWVLQLISLMTLGCPK